MQLTVDFMRSGHAHTLHIASNVSRFLTFGFVAAKISPPVKQLIFPTALHIVWASCNTCGSTTMQISLTWQLVNVFKYISTEWNDACIHGSLATNGAILTGAWWPPRS